MAAVKGVERQSDRDRYGENDDEGGREKRLLSYSTHSRETERKTGYATASPSTRTARGHAVHSGRHTPRKKTKNPHTQFVSSAMIWL